MLQSCVPACLRMHACMQVAAALHCVCADCGELHEDVFALLEPRVITLVVMDAPVMYEHVERSDVSVKVQVVARLYDSPAQVGR